MKITWRWQAGLAWALAVLAVAPALAQENRLSKASGEFYRGYYLRHHQQDFEKAAKAYQNAIELGLKNELRDQAKQAMLELEEELATQDFAGLMPKESLGYIELSNPANHVELLAKSMGLVGQKFEPSQKVTLQIEDGLAISSDFQLSPALLREMKKFRGAAVAITDINQSGPPVSGLAVIHPGDSDLLGGLLETGVQLIPAGENLQGFPTFNIENEVWLVKTHRLILVSDSKEQIEAGLNRLKKGQPGLSDVSAFQAARKDAENAAVFAFVNPKSVLEKYGRMFKGEVAIARMALDLDSLEFVSAAFEASDEGLRSRLAVRYEDGHNSLAFGLIRTAPLGETSLEMVPQGAAVVAGMGVNPQMLLAAQAAGASQLSALDIGREIFANIKEVSLFVLPTADTSGLPDFGMVVVSNDVEKSNKLWNELMSIPARMEVEEGPQARTITIADHPCREYTFPDKEIPRLVMTRIADQAMIVGSSAGVAAVLDARATKQTLANDEGATAFWNAKTSETSKAVYVNVGRAIQMAAQVGGGRDVQEMLRFGDLTQDLCVTTVVDETDNDLLVKTAVTGLPKFETVIQTLAKMQPRYTSQRRGRRADVQPSVSDRPTRPSRLKATETAFED